MKYLHKAFKASKGWIIEVNIDCATRVLFMKDSEFRKYKEGRSFTCAGKLYEPGKIEFVVKEPSTWHVVVERGSYFHPLQINATACLVPPSVSVPETGINGAGNETHHESSPTISESGETTVETTADTSNSEKKNV